MIDMGFEKQVAACLDNMAGRLRPLPGEAEDEAEMIDGKVLYRTTHMYSATMPPSVQRMAKAYCRDPVTVVIGDQQNQGKNKRITQRFVWAKSATQRRAI